MKIATRLIFAFTIMIVILVTIGLVGYTNVDTLDKKTDMVANNYYPKTVWANNIVDQVNFATRVVRDMLTTDNKEDSLK